MSGNEDCGPPRTGSLDGVGGGFAPPAWTGVPGPRTRKPAPLAAGRRVRASEQLPGSVTPGDPRRAPSRPRPGRCAWQPRGRISWHSAENKQRSAPVIPLPRRRRSAGGGVPGACRGRGRGPAHAPRGGCTAREVPPPALGADILRIAPPGLPRCPGSDSSWQRTARGDAPARPAAAKTRGGGVGRGRGLPSLGQCSAAASLGPQPPVHVAPHAAPCSGARALHLQRLASLCTLC